ncbi:MAG: hypothetical protein O2800_07185 [Planctomycetota bacterium]|nr:hypothetical protein [Planctomycetota bacterium]
MEQHQRVTVDSVDWHQLIRFPAILSSVAAAMRGSRLLVGLVTMLVVVTGGRVWDAFAPARLSAFGLTAGPMSDMMLESSQHTVRGVLIPLVTSQAWPSHISPETVTANQGMDILTAAMRSGHSDLNAEEYSRAMAILDAARPRGTYESLHDQVALTTSELLQHVFALQFADVTESAWTLLVRIPESCWHASRLFTAVFGLFSLVVIGSGAGIIARLAAFDLAGGPQPSLQSACRFVQLRRRHFLFAPLTPALVALLLWILAAAPALLMRVPGLDILAALWVALAIPIALLACIVIGVLTLGAPLLAPSIACDNCDGTEAVQRSGSYLIARPVHALCYAIAGLLTFALGMLLVEFSLSWAFNSVISLNGWIGNPEIAQVAGTMEPLHPMQSVFAFVPGFTANLSATILLVWKSAMAMVIAGYAFALLWTISTRIYILLRNAADGEPMDEIARDD